MYCLANMCYVCLEKKDKSLININSSLTVNKDIIHIIGYLPFNLGWMKTKQIILICEECCRRLRETYQLLAMCLKNSALLQGYMDQLNTASMSTADNEAELRVELNNKHDDTNEIKLEDEEIYTFERGPIIEESEGVFVNVDESFIKEEDTWKKEKVEDMEESPMDNNFTENSDQETDSEISVNSNTHDTETDSESSGFTRKQVHATNKEMNEAAKSLMKHTRVHTRNKSHACSDCGKCFISKRDLCSHERVHTGEKPFKCSTCEKCFKRQSHLTTHLRVHTGEKPFQCSTCGKFFGYKFVLERHMRVHTGEKPFKCLECHKCFSLRWYLAAHMRIHTGEKPFECSECGLFYRTPLNLSSHMRTHTGT